MILAFCSFLNYFLKGLRVFSFLARNVIYSIFLARISIDEKDGVKLSPCTTNMVNSVIKFCSNLDEKIYLGLAKKLLLRLLGRKLCFIVYDCRT